MFLDGLQHNSTLILKWFQSSIAMHIYNGSSKDLHIELCSMTFFSSTVADTMLQGLVINCSLVSIVTYFMAQVKAVA